LDGKVAVIEAETEKEKSRQEAAEKADAANKKAKEKREADKKEQKAIDDANEKEKAKVLELIRLAEIDTEAERRAEELRQVQLQYTNLIAEATKYGQDTTQLKEAQRTKENELQAKFDAEDDAKALEKKQKEDEYWNTEADKAIARTAKAKEESDKQIEIDKLAFENKQKMLGDLSSILGQAVSLLGEQTAAGKALGVAQATIDTYKGISGVWGAPSPYPEPFGTAIKVASTAIIAASGFANVKKILAVKVPGGRGGGVSAPNMSTPTGGVGSAPQFNVVGNTGVNQIANTLQNQPPVTAIVVASNVTSAQSANRNIVQNASLG
jgi:chemotaxis protein histidine kinase CheA